MSKYIYIYINRNKDDKYVNKYILGINILERNKYILFPLGTTDGRLENSWNFHRSK